MGFFTAGGGRLENDLLAGCSAEPWGAMNTSTLWLNLGGDKESPKFPIPGAEPSPGRAADNL